MKLKDIAAAANASMYHRPDFKKIKGAFYPRNEDELAEAVKRAREGGYEITPKGGGSGLSAGCTGGNAERVIVSSLKMDKVLSISLEEGHADVQAGITPVQLNDILATMSMKFLVTPSSRDIATIGGLMGTDGGGNDTWANGTMRDNTLHAKVILYDGTKLKVGWDGVECENEVLEAALNKKGMNLNDLASSHGTIGFVSELRVKIKPLPRKRLLGGLAEYENANVLGEVLTTMIEEKCPITYGEAIVEAHPDVRGDLKPPLLILEFPFDYSCDLREITHFEPLTKTELNRMKEIRLKLPKRNPKDGVQVALFEGYGFHGENLLNMQEGISEINSLLQQHDFVPFAKSGHAPSKWYLGDNHPAYGIVMHSREIRPQNKSGVEIYKTVEALVAKCQELGITPKPEHKWPFADEVKKARLQELRMILGERMNSFIFEPNCASETLASMV